MKVAYAPIALDQLEGMPKSVRTRIVAKIYFYSTQADPLAFAKRLSNSSSYRFRIGDYRVLFDVVEDTIEVLKVVKRDKAYKDL